jgi:DNA-binding MarR family transcriptional regulator
MGKERVLDLADEVFRLSRDRVPMDFLHSDLTMRQLKVLYTLYIDGPHTCGALASDQELSLSTMTGILARLERRGYLRRRRDSRDSRRVISTLSRRGRELVDRLWASGRDALADVLADVPADDLRTVERAMEILVEALRPSAAAPLPVGALADDE